MPTPRSTLQFRNTVHERAREGKPFSNEEIDHITRETVDLANTSQEKQQLQLRQQEQEQTPEQSRWAAAVDKVLHKPADQIGQGDAKELHNAEMKAFQNLPAKGSVASHVQSQADMNDQGRE